jgi:NAD(P)-dependent dehydrogenase (short-subunit alcohol dehydrogenase family)
VLASRREELCRRAAENLARDHGGRALGVRCDVGDPGDVERLVGTVVERMGRLDILVNNAGMTRKALLDEARIEDWDAVLRTNLTGTMLCSQAAARVMIPRRSGKIVNVASIYGVVGVDQRLYEASPGFVPGSIPYVASKGGVVQMTRDMAVYLAPHGINVNCLSPGGVASSQDAEFVKRYEGRTPLGRMGRPHDVKGAVVLLSSAAGDYITGQNLLIDGGWTAW